MNYHIRIEESDKQEVNGHVSFPLLGQQHGCTGGCCSGISIYSQEEYCTPGVHLDQEGFFVLSGIGWVMIGEKEIPIQQGTSFIVPPGIPHSIKKDEDSEPIKVFWFHASP